MTGSYIALPTPKAVQKALQTTTEGLAYRLANPQHAAPDWSELEWLVATAVAALHGVSPLLAGVLKWQGPPRWNQFLQEQRAHTTIRFGRIQELLRHLDASARSGGIALVALKGAELHAMGLYQAGERPMADVDLLVRSCELARATQLLESCGFRRSFSNWRHHLFVSGDTQAQGVLGEHAGNYLKVELHERISERLPLDIADVAQWVFPVDPHAGLNPYPSRASLMTHLLLHAAGAMAFRAIRLLHLHDLALLSSRMTAADWDELIDNSHRGGHWWAFPPLQLVCRYYLRAVPSHVLSRLEDDCPAVLKAVSKRRTLSDLSFSDPWIRAFPGIEWSQSLSEATRYALSRIRPDAEAQALRQEVASTYVSTAGNLWHQSSQSRRILRWIVSRPTRAQTMHAVHAALALAAGR